MYGLVNNAFVEYAVNKIGLSNWQKICNDKGFQQVPFQNLDSYSDESTVGIVVALSKEMGVSVDECLKELGEYWIEFALKSPYSVMITNSGNTLKALIQNLDSLHTRLSLTFTELKAPSFWVSEINQEEFNLHYSSEREGLNSFVEGLLVGLSNQFQTSIEMSKPQIGDSRETLWRIKTANA